MFLKGSCKYHWKWLVKIKVTTQKKPKPGFCVNCHSSTIESTRCPIYLTQWLVLWSDRKMLRWKAVPNKLQMTIKGPLSHILGSHQVLAVTGSVLLLSSVIWETVGLVWRHVPFFCLLVLEDWDENVCVLDSELKRLWVPRQNGLHI